jgi:tetratricopeptide (TPR) repeat protein
MRISTITALLALSLACGLCRAEQPGAAQAAGAGLAGANALLEGRDYAAAAKAYEDLGPQTGHKREGWRQNNWGLALLRLNKPAASVEHFEKAVEADPKNFTARANLGAAWERVGDRAKALDVYRRALELIRDENKSLASGRTGPAAETETHENLAAAQAESPTARLVEKASALQGDALKEALRKASELLDSGQYQQASDAYAAVGQTAPAQREGWRLNNWGLCYLRLADFADARERLERSVEAFPGNPVAWNNLAIAYEQLGLVDKAKDAWSKAGGNAGDGQGVDPQRFELSQAKLDFAAERRRWEALSR